MFKIEKPEHGKQYISEFISMAQHEGEAWLPGFIDRTERERTLYSPKRFKKYLEAQSEALRQSLKRFRSFDVTNESLLIQAVFLMQQDEIRNTNDFVFGPDQTTMQRIYFILWNKFKNLRRLEYLTRLLKGENEPMNLRDFFADTVTEDQYKLLMNEFKSEKAKRLAIIMHTLNNELNVIRLETTEEGRLTERAFIILWTGDENKYEAVRKTFNRRFTDEVKLAHVPRKEADNDFASIHKRLLEIFK